MIMVAAAAIGPHRTASSVTKRDAATGAVRPYWLVRNLGTGFFVPFVGGYRKLLGDQRAPLRWVTLVAWVGYPVLTRTGRAGPRHRLRKGTHDFVSWRHSVIELSSGARPRHSRVHHRARRCVIAATPKPATPTPALSALAGAVCRMAACDSGTASV